MKGNRRRQWSFGKRWISLMIIAAMLASMFSGFVLAEETEAAAEYEAVEAEEPSIDAEDEPEADDEGEAPFEEEEPAPAEEAPAEEAPVEEEPVEEEPYSEPELPVEEEPEPEPQPEPQPVEEPSEPEPEEERDVPTIIVVNAPSRLTYELDAKPAHDDFADSLPGSLTVILSDGTVTEAAVEWHCDDYSSDYGRFVFVPTIVGSDYALDRDVELPTAALYIRYISDVSMKGKYAPIVAKKPASDAEDVARKLKWPDEVKATLVGADETTVTLPVVWECDDYSRYDSGDFTFTAAFGPEVDYIIGRKLKMPAITLRVISDKQFTFDINSDDEIIITGLRNDRTEAIEIPAKIEGLKVVEIDEKAFEDCSNLMMVTVSDGIEKIGAKAFAGCDELIAVELPDSLRSVAKDAFDKKVLKTLAIVLNVSGDDTRLTDEDTFKRDGKSVHLPADIDSILVRDDAELTIDTDFTVESDSLTGITVERYGKLTLRKGKKLINNGTITVEGEFINKGKVYGCNPDSRLYGDIDGYITEHTGKKTCKICGERIIEVEEEPTPAPVVEEEPTATPEPVVEEEPTPTPVPEIEEEPTPVPEIEDENAIEEPVAEEAEAELSETVEEEEQADAADSVDADLDNTASNDLSSEAIEVRTIEKVYNADFDDYATLAERVEAFVNMVVEATVFTEKSSGKTLKLYDDYEVDKNLSVEGAETDDLPAQDYKFTFTGIGDYTGVREITVTVVDGVDPRMDISDWTVTLPDREYNGQPIEVVDFSLSDNDGYVLVEGTDYVLSYSEDHTNVGTVTVTVTAIGEKYRGKLEATFNITPFEITQDNDVVTIEPIPDQPFTGAQIMPVLVVKDKDEDKETVLTEGKDYSVTYGENINPGAGAGSVTIAGIGNYTGSKTATFNILNKGLYIHPTFGLYKLAGEDDPELEWDYTGLVEGDPKPTGTLAREKGEEPGTYEYDVSGISVEGYAVVLADDADEFTILDPDEPRELTFRPKTKASLMVEYSPYPLLIMDDEEVRDRFDIGLIDPDDEDKLTLSALAIFDQGAAGETVNVEVLFFVNVDEGAKREYNDLIDKKYTSVIQPKNIADVELLPIDDQAYSGQSIKPDVIMANDSELLEAGRDYELAYDPKEPVNEGTVTVTITGVGNYTGTRTTEFSIVKRELLNILYTGATLTRPYDGTKNCALEPADFEIVGASGVTIVAVKAEYLTAAVGDDKPVNLTFTFEPANTESQYVVIEPTLTGSITVRDISKGSDVTAEIDDQTYTGEQIEPLKGDITIKVGSLTLTPSDFTIKSYGDNKNVDGGGTVTVTGRGNFTGDRTFDFDILPRNISRGSDVKAEIDAQTYIGKKIELVKSDLTVKVDGVELSNSDYNIKSNGDNISVAEGGTVTITGKGNYTGDRTFDFDIVARDISKGSGVSAVIDDQTYTGADITLEKSSITLRLENDVVLSGSDYDIASYANNKNVGTATVTFRGKGNCTGEKSFEFDILPRDIGDATATITEQAYTGSQIKPGQDSITVVVNKVTLSNADYEITSYGENIEVGTGTVTIKGVGNYVGEKTFNFNITDKQTREVKITLISGHEPVRTYDGTSNCGYYTKDADGKNVYHPLLKSSDFLVEGVADGDTVVVSETYLYNRKFDGKDAGDRSVTLSLAGNLTVTSTQYTYTVSADSIKIVRGKIEPKELTINPGTRDATTKEELPATKVYGTADKSTLPTLISGLLSGDTITGKPGREPGEDVGKYKYTVGTLDAGKNYTIVIGDKLYEITPKPINAADVTVPESVKSPESYTGSAITKSFTIKYGSETLALNKDYTVSYSNNTEVGTATLTITGTGNYNNSRSAPFSITAKSIQDEDVDIAGFKSSIEYSPNGNTQAITIKHGSRTLTVDKDYSVSYANNTNVSTTKATITIKGVGNYNGTYTNSFSITARPVSNCTVTVATISSNSGSAQTPAVTVKDGTKTLVEGTDYTKTYTNNTNTTTSSKQATVTITGKGNYSGTKQQAFTIPGKSSSSSGSSSSSSSSGSSSSGSSSSGGTTVITITPTPAPVVTPSPTPAPDETIEPTPTPGDKEGETGATEEAAEEETEPEPETVVEARHGQLLLSFENVTNGDELPEPKEDVPVGYVLFDGENRPSPFGYEIVQVGEPKVIDSETGMAVLPDGYNYGADGEILDADGNEVEPEPPVYQLIISPEPEQDANGDARMLGDGSDREYFGERHLRLTPTQIDILKSENFDELLYRVDYAELRVKLEDLTEEINLTPVQPEPSEDDEVFEVMEDADADGVEAPVDEVSDLEMASTTKHVDSYEITIVQVKADNITDREKEALKKYDRLLPVYRVDLNAVVGELPVVLDDAADDTENRESEVDTYPMLGKIESAELRINDSLLLPKRLAEANQPISIGTQPVPDSGDDPAYTTELPENTQLLVILAADDDTDDEENLTLYPVTALDASEVEDDEDWTEEAEPAEELEAEPEDRLFRARPDRLGVNAEAERMFRARPVIAMSEAEEPEAETIEAEPEAETPVAQYVTNDKQSDATDYGRVLLTRSGLYAFVLERPEDEIPEEDEWPMPEEVEDDIPLPTPEPRPVPTVEPAEAPDEPAAPTPEPTPTPVPTPTPTPEPTPEPALVEDPESMYAYNRRSTAGNQYWLINTRAKTVEYYRVDTDAYQIGDYTGSLMSGMQVTFRTPLKTTTIKLKFQQTYKFALMDDEGGELLMEQTDISEVEAIMQGQRK